MFGKKASEQTLIMREAIRQVLARATAPMAPSEIYKQPEVQALGVEKADFTLAVAHTFLLKGRDWPMMRVPGGPSGGNLYFNPDVTIVGAAAMANAQSSETMGAPKVNDANPGDFGFAPQAFAAEQVRITKPAGRKPGSKNKPKEQKVTAAAKRYPVAPPVDAQNPVVPVHMPAGVKSITLSVAGVTIKIDLG